MAPELTDHGDAVRQTRGKAPEPTNGAALFQWISNNRLMFTVLVGFAVSIGTTVVRIFVTDNRLEAIEREVADQNLLDWERGVGLRGMVVGIRLLACRQDAISNDSASSAERRRTIDRCNDFARPEAPWLFGGPLPTITQREPFRPFQPR